MAMQLENVWSNYAQLGQVTVTGTGNAVTSVTDSAGSTYTLSYLQGLNGNLFVTGQTTDSTGAQRMATSEYSGVDWNPQQPIDWNTTSTWITPSEYEGKFEYHQGQPAPTSPEDEVRTAIEDAVRKIRE